MHHMHSIVLAEAIAQTLLELPVKDTFWVIGRDVGRRSNSRHSMAALQRVWPTPMEGEVVDEADGGVGDHVLDPLREAHGAGQPRAHLRARMRPSPSPLFSHCTAALRSPAMPKAYPRWGTC